MGLLRGIGRAAPLVAAGLVAGWYLRRQGLLGGPPRAQLPWPPEPAPPPEPAEVEEHAEAVEAVSDAADVAAVVEDLLAAAPGEEERIVDAEVVEEEEEEGGLAGAVRVALAEIPGLLSG